MVMLISALLEPRVVRPNGEIRSIEQLRWNAPNRSVVKAEIQAPRQGSVDCPRGDFTRSGEGCIER